MAKNPFELYSVTRFYHFTDRRNLEAIRHTGGLYSFAKLQEMKIEIPAPGGNQWSRDADDQRGLDRYVHLCFKANHPMEYTARQEGRIGDSIFLQIHPDVLKNDGVMFTPDVSNKAGVEMITMEKALEVIDFPVLYTRTDWTDPKVQARLQLAEKCEILIPDHIPMNLIRNLPIG
jgi:hypothetical protein